MKFHSCSVTIGMTRRYNDWATDWTTEESWFDSRKGQKFPSSVKRPDQLRLNPASYKMGIEGSGDSILSSAQIKNECSYTFTHPMTLWNVQGQLYFTVLCETYISLKKKKKKEKKLLTIENQVFRMSLSSFL